MPSTAWTKSSGSSLAGISFKNRAFGIGIGEHEPGTKFRPIFKNHTASPAVAHINLRHWGRRANLNPEFLSCSRKRLSDSAHSAHYMSEESLKFVVTATQQMKQQADRGTGLIRSPVLAIDVVGQKQCLNFVGFIVAIEKFAQTAG